MKVLIVDDHALIREAVRHVVAALDDDVTVLAAADNARGFAIAEAEPGLELLLLDFHVEGLAGVPAIRAWRQRFPALPVVVLSSTEDRTTVLAAMSAGAAGYVPKSSSNEVMVSALNVVLAGGRYLPAEVLAQPASPAGARVAPASLDALGLTPRQLDVLKLLAVGKPNKLICDELGLAERTVKAHVTEVMRALGVHSRTQAALAAARLGLGQAPG
jgi:DNA-binding NarL/FixJ family response regulator